MIARASEAPPPGLPRLYGLADAYLAYVEADTFPGGCFFASVLTEVAMQAGPVRERLVAFLSVPWYAELFEADPVLDEDTGPFPHVVWMLAGTMFGLHQFPDTDTATPFSERRVGLDHVAFACADRGELEHWEKRRDQLAVTHGGIKDAGYGSGLAFRDPDGLPLEFFAAPQLEV